MHVFIAPEPELHIDPAADANTTATTEATRSRARSTISPERTSVPRDAGMNERGKQQVLFRMQQIKYSLDQIGIGERSLAGLTEWHTLLIKLEARCEDFNAGHLTPRYFAGMVDEAMERVQSYWDSLAPEGWQCLYDWTKRKYLYLNQATGETVWRYPSVSAAVSAAGTDDEATAATPPPLPTEPPPPLPLDENDGVAPPPPPPDDTGDDVAPPPPPPDDEPPDTECTVGCMRVQMWGGRRAAACIVVCLCRRARPGVYGTYLSRVEC